MTQKTAKVLAGVVTVLSAALVVPGWFAPSFSLVPSFGDTLDVFLTSYFPDEMAAQTFSLIGGIVGLFRHGDYGIGLLLLGFSVLFPVVKLLVLLLLCLTNCNAPGRLRHLCHGFLKYFSKWSMLDVFVIAIFVIGFKQFPGGTRIQPEWGLFVFGAGILLSIAASALVKRAEAQPHAEGLLSPHQRQH